MLCDPLFTKGVEICYLHFLSPEWSKLENFSAHHMENFLIFSKLTKLLILVVL